MRRFGKVGTDLQTGLEEGKGVIRAGRCATLPRLPIRVDYVPRSREAVWPKERTTLAAIGFADNNSVDPLHPGRFYVGTPQLGNEPTVELWTSRAPVRWDNSGPWAVATSGDVLFGYCLTDDSTTGIEGTSFRVYQELIAVLRRKRYGHLVRIWHYFPQINDEEASLERYRAFNRGRSRALELAPEIAARLPASTAIGTRCPGLLVYFLASRHPATQVENPRQVSAFRYPTRYGPRSPSFSRATLAGGDDATALFISGTASIIGHVSVHGQSVLRQLDEILRNIDALMHAARQRDPRIPPRTGDLSAMKVYLRNPANLSVVRERLENAVDPQVPLVFLCAEICRSDLLLEIEGFYL
jgi:chorismate lyase/3-hydroxybenzoate synthase